MDQMIRRISNSETDVMARSRIYQLLSVAFRYPTEDFFESLLDNRYMSAFSEALAGSHYHESLLEKELLEIVEEIEALSAEMSYEDYQVCFTETLEVGTPKPPCPPYEGFQRKPLSRHAIMLKIMAFYKHFGLEMDRGEGKRELPDHIAAQLEFLHFLTFKELQAREIGNRSLLTGYLLAQHDFLQRHVLRWVPAFANKLDATRSGTALALFAEITRDILQKEAELVKEYLRELGVDVKPPEPEDEKLSTSILPDESNMSSGGCDGCVKRCTE